MPVFKNEEDMLTVYGGLFKKVLEHPESGPKFIKAGFNIKINLTGPDGTIWLAQGEGSKGKVLFGESDLKSDVEMNLSSDTAHNFWLKHITLPGAMARGLLKTKGSLPKVIKLVPILTPAFEEYPEIARSNGLSLEKV